MNTVQQFKYNNSNDYELIKGIQKQVFLVGFMSLNLYSFVPLFFFF